MQFNVDNNQTGHAPVDIVAVQVVVMHGSFRFNLRLRDDAVVSRQRLVVSLLFRFTDAPYQASTARQTARVGHLQ